MKYKHIQAAHEARMWVIAIATGLTAAGKFLSDNPEVKRIVNDKVSELKAKYDKKRNAKTVTFVVVNSDGES